MVKTLEAPWGVFKEFWCPGPDLNWHVSLTQPRILSPVRLPISPPGHLTNRIDENLFSSQTLQLSTRCYKRKNVYELTS